MSTFNPEVLPPMSPEPSAQTSVPEYSLFDVRSVLIATVLSGPLGGSVLMAYNYRHLGEKSQAILAVLAGVAVTAAAVGLGFVIPNSFNLPIGIGLMFATRAVAQSLQGQDIAEHERRGGHIVSRWAAAGIGLGALCLVFLVLVAGIMGAQRMQLGPEVQVGKDAVHYSGSATADQAKSLGDELKSVGFFKDAGGSAKLTKDASGTTVALVVKDGSWDSAGMVSALDDMGRIIAPSVGGFPLHVQMVDSDYQVHLDSEVGEATFGTKDIVYYYGSATEADARSLGQTLKSDGYFEDQGANVMLSKHDSATAVAFVLKDGYWNDSSYVTQIEKMVRDSAPSIGGLPITLRLVNSALVIEKEEPIQ